MLPFDSDRQRQVETATPSSITKSVQKIFVQQFHQIYANAEGEMNRLVDFITKAYQIDNVVLLINGTLHGYEREDLLERCHPLGMFEALPAITIASSPNEIYHTVLAESPIGRYFKHCLSADDLNEMHVEMIRGSLSRAYLEHFHEWISGLTNEGSRSTMLDMLCLEADRRSLSILISTMGTGVLDPATKLRLMPRFGRLWESGTAERLVMAEDMTTFRQALEPVPEYLVMFPMDSLDNGKDDVSFGQGLADERTLEELLAEREVTMAKMSFAYPFTITPVYAWTRLKEQELRNIHWIAECIAQRQKSHISHYIPTS